MKGTNVAFQSSDGEWALREVLIKGLAFEHILVSFDAYKIQCNAQNAKFQRITKKPSWSSPTHYFNNYQEPKWFVPYAEAHENTKNGWYPPASLDHCSKRGYSDSIWNEAKIRAKTYVSKLSLYDRSLNSSARDMQLNQ